MLPALALTANGVVRPVPALPAMAGEILAIPEARALAQVNVGIVPLVTATITPM
jgi:hypothetical protein